MTLEIYSKFAEIYRSQKALSKPIKYETNEFEFPGRIEWLAYSFMYEEFTRELTNTINQMHDYMNRLTAWDQIFGDLDDRQKLAITFEFIDPIATLLLNLPYVIRSRFVFACAHLCHQANRAKGTSDWKDDFPLDNEVDFNQLDYYATGWTKYKRLKSKLEQISAWDYRERTFDFRNRYNHRFSPHIAYGYSSFVERKVNSAGLVTYSFGGVPPMEIRGVLEISREQHTRAIEALSLFRELVIEHSQLINKRLLEGPLTDEC